MLTKNITKPTIDILTEKELAARINRSYWTIRRWRQKEGLPHIYIGKRLYYRMEDVEEWIRALDKVSDGPTPDAPHFVNVA